mgnify:CR=1 FL=1
MTFPNWLQRLFAPPAWPPEFTPGLWHYQRAAGGTVARYHLRVEPDGHGLLVANASLAARLSPIGVIMARGLLEDTPAAALLAQASRAFPDAPRAALEQDLGRVQALITDLAAPGDGYPILNFDDAALVERPGDLIAPLNADVPLAPPERLSPLIARLWAVGIPHLTLIVPEAPDPGALLRAVERAEDTGLITGVRGRASDLAGGRLLEELAQAGVDHVNVYWAAADVERHDRLFGAGDQAAARAVFGRLQALEVCPVAEVPLVEATLPHLDETLAALNDLDVAEVGVFAVAELTETADDAVGADAMPQAAALMEAAADRRQVRYLWRPPVRRRLSLSLAAQVRRGPRCSDDLSARVEPDGTVIPPRGPWRSAGNLLKDEWATVWRHPEFRRFRARLQTPTRCATCPGLAVCAADCPREPAGWSEEA